MLKASGRKSRLIREI